jgi:hypothetical protein
VQIAVGLIEVRQRGVRRSAEHDVAVVVPQVQHPDPEVVPLVLDLDVVAERPLRDVLDTFVLDDGDDAGDGDR